MSERCKTGYSFDRVTGIFLGEETVWREEITGAYPCADNVVFIEPPECRKHEHARWDGRWLKCLEKGFKYVDGEIVELTLQEKVDAGIEAIPEGMKIENNEFVPKTMDDLFDEGVITISEYNSWVDAQRQIRYKEETDKMAFMYLRGECTLDEWKEAMDIIRKELPKKEEK